MYLFGHFCVCVHSWCEPACRRRRRLGGKVRDECRSKEERGVRMRPAGVQGRAGGRGDRWRLTGGGDRGEEVGRGRRERKGTLVFGLRRDVYRLIIQCVLRGVTTHTHTNLVQYIKSDNSQGIFISTKVCVLYVKNIYYQIELQCVYFLSFI